MKLFYAIVVLMAIYAEVIVCCEGAEYIYVKDITMHLKGNNATFQLNYSLDSFTNLYVLALGCKYIEPDLLSYFGNYTNVELMKASMNMASLQVQNAGGYKNGSYFFDSHTLGSKKHPLKGPIPKLTVIYPQGEESTFYNVTSTQRVVFSA